MSWLRDELIAYAKELGDSGDPVTCHAVSDGLRHLTENPRSLEVRDHVRDFHEKFGVPVGGRPVVLHIDRMRLRLSLVAEEFLELLGAAGVGSQTIEQIDGLLGEAIDADLRRPDLPSVAEALADLDYLVEGMRVEMGIRGKPIADAVHAANMAKEGGSMREDGKTLKPEVWVPPDVAGELKRQGWREGK